MSLPRNYRPGTPSRSCGNCRFLDRDHALYCTRWGEHVDRAYLCDAWQKRRTVTLNVKENHAAQSR